jgi:hypothetical protein
MHTFSRISDHNPTVFSIHGNPLSRSKTTVTKRNIKNIDENKFLQDMRAALSPINYTLCATTTVPSSENFIHNSWHEFNSELSTTLDVYAPLLCHTIRIKTRQPWFNNDLRHHRRKLRTLERHWRKTKSTISHDIYVAERKCYITRVTSCKTILLPL